MQQHLQESDKRIEDRFLCIDDDVYHIGASIKDLGKVVWFLQDGNKIVQRANRPTLGLYLGYRRHFHVAKTTRSPTGCQS